MSLDRLICSCLKPGTSFTEKGKTVTIAKRDDETILMFRTDSEIAKKILQIPRACDITYFYMRHRQRPKLLFVELKGKDIGEAGEQLRITIQRLRELIRAQTHPNFPQNIDIRAIAVRTGSAPHAQSKIQELFLRQTGVPLQFARVEAQLRDFLNR
jgi:hypothetical protein